MTELESMRKDIYTASRLYGQCMAKLGIPPATAEVYDLDGNPWKYNEYPFVHHAVVSGYFSARKKMSSDRPWPDRRFGQGRC